MANLIPLPTETLQGLLGELRYLVSAIEYGWDEDIQCVVERFKEDYPLLPEYGEDDEEGEEYSDDS